MIAENEIIIAMQLERRLRNLGYTVVAVAMSGRDAVAMEALYRPDVILMDIMMPGEIDGVQAARTIHKRREVPIIFLTAQSDEATLNRAMKTNPWGFISKPFRENDIRVSIELACNRMKTVLYGKQRCIGVHLYLLKLQENQDRNRRMVRQYGTPALKP